MGNHALRAALVNGFRSASTTFSTRTVPGDLNTQFLEAWRRADSVPGWLTDVNASAMFRTIAAVRPRRVVEIGSYLGRSTVFLASALDVLGIDGRVTAIDPHTGDRQHLDKMGVREMPSLQMFENHIAAAGVADRIDVVVGMSTDAASTWSEPIDFLYDDGWHAYDAVLADGRAFLPHLSEHGVVFFDDYTRYREVFEAVGQLDREGAFHLWGGFYGQAVGGRQAEPIPALRSALRIARTPLHTFFGERWMHA